MKKPLLEDYSLTKDDIEWHQYVNPKIQNYNDSVWTIKELKTSDGVGLAICMCIFLFYLIPLFFVCLIYNEFSYSKVKSITKTARWNNVQKYLDAVSQYNSSVDVIVSDYAEFISEHYRADLIWDVSKLPHPKDKIMEALIHANERETTSGEKKKAIADVFIKLSQFQEGVGKTLLGPADDLLKLTKGLDEDLESGEIDQIQFQKLLNEGLEDNKKKRKLYDEHDKLVMKERTEILPKRFLLETAKILMERKENK